MNVHDRNAWCDVGDDNDSDDGDDGDDPKTFTHTKIATQDAFAQTLLYKNSLQQGVYTQNLFYTNTHAFTPAAFTHTQMPLYRVVSIYTEYPLI